MKVAICSKARVDRIKRILLDNGFKIVRKNPDFILSYGGDGTVLYAERKYPGILKLIVKHDSRIVRGYDYKVKQLKKILKKIMEEKYAIIEEIKLVAIHKKIRLCALNEIQVRSKSPVKALRFSVYTERKNFDNLVGDGVIVATPFGSTAYYRSTGGKPFRVGIGLAFNNIFSEKMESVRFPDNTKIKIKIDRGVALLVADNYEKFFTLKEGDEVLIKKSDEKARFILV